MHKAVELNILLNIFVHVDPKMCFIVRFISLLGVEDLLAGNDGNESLDRRSVWYCCTMNREPVFLCEEYLHMILI